MQREPAVSTYVISEPYERGLKAVREALTRGDLAVSAELDVSNRIRRLFQLQLAPCRILLVDTPCLLLEATTLECSAGALLPLHLVVSGSSGQTMVHWLNPAAIEGVRLPVALSAPLLKLQSLLARSLERIAIRQDPYSLTVPKLSLAGQERE